MNPNSTDRLSSLLEDEEQQQKSGGTASQHQAKRKRQLNSGDIPSVGAVSTLSSSSSSSSGNNALDTRCRYAKRTRVPSNAENNDGGNGAAAAPPPASPAPTTANQSSASAHTSSLIGQATGSFGSTSGFVRPSTGSSSENVSATSTDHGVVRQSIVSGSSAFLPSSPRANKRGLRPLITAGNRPTPGSRSVPATSTDHEIVPIHYSVASESSSSATSFISIGSSNSTATSRDGAHLRSDGGTHDGGDVPEDGGGIDGRISMEREAIDLQDTMVDDISHNGSSGSGRSSSADMGSPLDIALGGGKSFAPISFTGSADHVVDGRGDVDGNVSPSGVADAPLIINPYLTKLPSDRIGITKSSLTTEPRVYRCQSSEYQFEELVIELGNLILKMEVKRLSAMLTVDMNWDKFVDGKMDGIEAISSATREDVIWNSGSAALEIVLGNAKKRKSTNGYSDVILDDLTDRRILLDPHLRAMILLLDPKNVDAENLKLEEARALAAELVRTTDGVVKRPPPSDEDIPLSDKLQVKPDLRKVNVRAKVPVLGVKDTNTIAKVFGLDLGYDPVVVDEEGMKMLKILTVALAFDHDLGFPYSLQGMKCYHSFQRDLFLEATILYTSGIVDRSKIVDGMNLSDCLVDLAVLSKPAKGCKSPGTYGSVLTLTLRNNVDGTTRTVSAIVRSGTAMGRADQDFEMEAEARKAASAFSERAPDGDGTKKKSTRQVQVEALLDASGLLRPSTGSSNNKKSGGKKKQKKKKSSGNSIGKRACVHFGKSGHKLGTIASTRHSRYVMVPDSSIERPDNIKGATVKLLQSMFDVGDNENITGVGLEDKVVFALSEKGVTGGAAAAVFCRGREYDAIEDGDSVDSRANRRSYLGYVLERATSLLVPHRHHFNRSNLSFERYRWRRIVSDCSAAVYEEMAWKLDNFNDLSACTRFSIRNTVELAVSSGGSLSEYSALRSEFPRRSASIRTDEVMSLFLAAQDDGQFKQEVRRSRYRSTKSVEDVWNNRDKTDRYQLYALRVSAAFFVEECNGDREEYETQRKLTKKTRRARQVTTDHEAAILLECWLEMEEAAARKAEKETSHRRDVEVVRRILVEAIPAIKEWDHCAKKHVERCVYLKMEPALVKAKVGVEVSVVMQMVETAVNAYFQAKSA